MFTIIAIAITAMWLTGNIDAAAKAGVVKF